MIFRLFKVFTSAIKSQKALHLLKVLFMVLWVALLSCQRVIDLNLNSSETYMVVQGNIYDKTGPYTVTLSQTVDFDEDNEYPTVSGAFVTINDGNGVVDTLDETDWGEYTTTKLEGTPGNTYYLTITTDDGIYTASSYMPEPVEIDTIYFDESSRDDDVYETTIEFTDPAGVDNYYRIVFFYNDKQSEQVFVVSDNLYDGETMTYTISSMGKDDTSIQLGQKVTIWLQSIDKDVYEFFRTASTNSNESVTPSNPETNITNGALGYFNCCSYTVISSLVSVSK